MMSDMKQFARVFSVIGMMGMFLFVWSGCATDKKAEPDPFFDTWRMKADTTKGYSPNVQPPKVEASGEANQPTDAPEDDMTPQDPRLPTVLVNLSMHNAPVAAVLRALARAADQSIMISDSVSGIANVSAADTPWDMVFLGILNTYGLVFEYEGGILKIKTPEDLDKERARETAELRQQELRRLMEQSETFETEIFFIRYANAAALGDILDELIQGDGQSASTLLEADTVTSAGSLQQASVTVDAANNAILVHASKGKIRQMARVVEELDRPTLQVYIEAQIVETNRDTARALGVQWGGLNFEEGGEKFHWIGGASGQFDGSLFTEAEGDDPGGDTIIHIPPISNIINFPADLEDGIGATLGYQLQDISSNYILTMQLSALQEEGKLNILSTPSITTLDNQTASIESGREVPFQTVETAGGTAVVKVEFKKAVLSLKVTPHIIDDNMLRLNVITHKDELDFTNEVQGNPTIITKNAETNVILFDGQTMVIGGLSKEIASDSESGVPVLKNIPVLGHLFKSTGKSSNMEEVLIFITPRILKEKSEEYASTPLDLNTEKETN